MDRPNGKSLDYRLLKAGGTLDGTTPEGAAFRETLAAACEAIDRDIVLDLSAAQYLDSRAIGEIVRLCAACEGAGARLVLFVPPSPVRQTLELVGLAKLAPLVDSIETLEAAFGLHPGRRKRRRIPRIDYDRLAGDFEAILLGEGGQSESAELKKLIEDDEDPLIG